MSTNISCSIKARECRPLLSQKLLTLAAEYAGRGLISGLPKGTYAIQPDFDVEASWV